MTPGGRAELQEGKMNQGIIAFKCKSKQVLEDWYYNLNVKIITVYFGGRGHLKEKN